MAKVEKLKAKGNIDALLGLLSHRKENIREEACEAVIEMGAGSLNQLVSLLGNRLNPVNSRIMAAKALGGFNDPATIQPLIQGLSEEGEVAAECVKGLIKFGNAAVPSLIGIIHQDSPHKSLAVAVLGQIGDPAAIPILTELITTQDVFLRKEIISALGNLGDTASAEVLVNFLVDKNPEIRAATAQALGQLKVAEALPYLEQMLFDGQEIVRNSAKGAIETISQFL